MKKYWLVCAALMGFAACKKTASEDEQIRNYLTANGLTAQSTPEGIYYIIDSVGTGSTSPTPSNSVTVKYKGYLLNGTQFDAGTLQNYNLSGLILGWQIGLQKFKKGGKGKLFIPSPYGYGTYGSGPIPGKTPIAFDIELIDFR